MKRTIIRTYGDANFGMGHVYRSLAIARHLKENCGHEVLFAFTNSDAPIVKDIIQAAGFKFEDHLEGLSSQSSFLIYDMPFFDQVFFDSITQINFTKKIGLDYFTYSSRDVDLALNLFNHGDCTRSLFPIKEGIRYAIIRDEILVEGRNRDKNDVIDLRKLLITFGSADPSNNTCTFLNSLVDGDFDITIILGALFKFDIELKEVMRKFTKARFTLLKDVKDIQKNILESDLAICGGGTTILECIYLVTPALVISQTQAELSFSASLKNTGLCLTLPKEELQSLDIEKIASIETRKRIMEACSRVSIGHGKEEIVKELVG